MAEAERKDLEGQELEDFILKAIGEEGGIQDTVTFSKKHGIDHKKIAGVALSLSSLDYIGKEVICASFIWGENPINTSGQDESWNSNLDMCFVRFLSQDGVMKERHHIPGAWPRIICCWLWHVTYVCWTISLLWEKRKGMLAESGEIAPIWRERKNYDLWCMTYFFLLTVSLQWMRSVYYFSWQGEISHDVTWRILYLFLHFESWCVTCSS